MFRIIKKALPSQYGCKQFSSDITRIPLTQSISKTSSHSQTVVLPDRSSINVTVLENGLTVASQHKFGMHCTIGAMVKAGPRYENGSINGVSHFIEKLGFHSTDAFIDRDALQAKMETCNAIYDCQIARDFIVYASSGVRRNAGSITQIISETLLRPKITDVEVDEAAKAIGFELTGLDMLPPVDPILTELLHSAAFHANNTFGLPRYCPKENIRKISRIDVMKFMASYYRPDRVVLVGVGVDHEDFLKHVESNFVPWETTYSKEIPESDLFRCDDSTPLYYGGEMTLNRDLSQYHAPMPEFAHCAIGLESCGTKDEFFVASCLLNSFLGGGGSFSAGGPGKGMYTRLYTNILNQYHWVNSAQAFNHSYADAGVFAVTGSADPANLHHLIRALVDELRYTAEAPIEPNELQRAKNQLESMLLMNLEMNPVAFEDIARQILGTGEWKPPVYWVEKINAVTAEDLQNLLKRMFKSRMTMVGFGRMDKWPVYQDTQQQLSAPLHPTRGSKGIPSFFKRFC